MSHPFVRDPPVGHRSRSRDDARKSEREHSEVPQSRARRMRLTPDKVSGVLNRRFERPGER